MKNAMVILAAALLLAACEKEETPGRGAAELLTRAPWQYAGEMVDLNDNLQPDEALLPAEACIADERVVFQTDGTYQVVRGSVRCNNPEAPVKDASRSGTWTLQNHDRALQLSGGAPSPIVELSEQRMTLHADFDGRHAVFELYQR